MRICLVSTGLGTGGAESMLISLVEGYLNKGHACAVISLEGDGTYGMQLRELGCEVLPANLRGKGSSLGAILQVWQFLNRFSPDVLHGWMYHGCLAATFFGYLTRKKLGLVWTIHQSLYDIRKEKPRTALVIKVLARLSRFPKIVSYVSNIGLKQHLDFGFNSRNARFLPNGFSSERYKSRAHREDYRARINAEEGDVVVGSVARLHPMKDHPNLIRAFSLACATAGNLKLVCIGPGVVGEAPILRSEVDRSRQESKISLLGESRNIVEWLQAMDVFVVASAWGEACPMVIGEAMASGLPCVVTQVGDSPWMVGGAGVSVLPSDSEALAKGILSICQLSDEKRGQMAENARKRVEAEFDIPQIVDKYLNIYSIGDL